MDDLSTPIMIEPGEAKMVLQQINKEMDALLAQMQRDQAEIEKLKSESLLIVADIADLKSETRSKLENIEKILNTRNLPADRGA